jgi:hypothetical protein
MLTKKHESAMIEAINPDSIAGLKNCRINRLFNQIEIRLFSGDDYKLVIVRKNYGRKTYTIDTYTCGNGAVDHIDIQNHVVLADIGKTFKRTGGGVS